MFICSEGTHNKQYKEHPQSGINNRNKQSWISNANGEFPYSHQHRAEIVAESHAHGGGSHQTARCMHSKTRLKHQGARLAR